MDSLRVNSAEKDQQVAILERKLRETTQQLLDKDAECKDFKKKYYQTMVELVNREETIDALKNEANKKEIEFAERKQLTQRSIDDLYNNVRQLQNGIESLSAGSNELQLGIYDSLSHNQNLINHIQRLQSELEARSETLKNLQSENNILKHDLRQKELQYEECKQKIEWFIDQEYLPGTILEIDCENGQVEQMPQEVEDDQRTQPELIDLSGDDEDEEGHGLPEFPQELVDEFQQWDDSGSGLAPGDEIEEEEVLPVETPVQSGRKEDQSRKSYKRMRLTDEEEALLVQTPVQEPEVLEEQDGFEHIADITEQRPSFSNGFSGTEMNQIIDYIFNICKPLPAFGDKYWLYLSSRLKNDTGSSRSMNSLKSNFSKTMFHLYKMKKLHTAEHRTIAVMAFHTYGRKWINELTEQYDKARLPGTTDEEIQQMESLAWRREAEAVKRSRSSPPKVYSVEEDNMLIELVFNAKDALLGEPNSTAYWEGISAEFKQANYSRPARSLKSRFKNVLLPKLHNRSELNTPNHRKIAVELYESWLEPDMSNHHIQLYDDARPPIDADDH